MLFDPSYEPYVPRPVEYLMNTLYKANNNELPAGLNYFTLPDHPTIIILVTDTLSKIIDDDWGSENFNQLTNIASPDYWNAYVNERQSFPIDEEGPIGESANVTDMGLAPEYVIYLDKLKEGYQYSLLQYNTGLYFEDESNAQPFSEFPLFKSGIAYSGLDVVMYLMQNIAIPAFDGPLEIKKETIAATKQKLSELQMEYLKLHDRQFENEFDDKLDEIDRVRHELLFKILADHKISVPVADPLVMDYVDDTLRGNIYYSLSTCEHPVIRELYNYWVKRAESEQDVLID